MSIASVVRTVSVLAALALVGAACAGPRAAAPTAPAAGVPAGPPPGVAAPSPLIAADERVAPVTALLLAAKPADVPRLLIKRAQACVESAQALRWSKMKSWDIIPPDDEKRYLAFYELAQLDSQAILERYPGSAEAATAQLTLAIIQDYPHMSDFAKADALYQLTMERYPGTPAAREATERLRKIREKLGDPKLPPPPKP